VVGPYAARIDRKLSPKISIRSVTLGPGRENEPFGVALARGTAGRAHHSFDAPLASPSQASNQVNVLVAGLDGRCPCLSAVSRAQPSGVPKLRPRPLACSFLNHLVVITPPARTR
jgi:hypothetical protein